jgi:hypothetical protein
MDPPATVNSDSMPEMVEQHRLRTHHVANCDDGKFRPGLPF